MADAAYTTAARGVSSHTRRNGARSAARGSYYGDIGAYVIVRMIVANPLTAKESAPSPRAKVEDCFMPLKSLSKYSGLSVRTLRTYLSHAIRPLPHYRPGGKILVKRSEFDDWIARFKATEFSKGSAILAELLTDL